MGEDLEEAIAWAEQASPEQEFRARSLWESADHNAIFASVSELDLAPKEAANIDLNLPNHSSNDWETMESSEITIGTHCPSPDGEKLVWSEAGRL